VVRTRAFIEFTCYVKLVTIVCGQRTRHIFMQEHFLLSDPMHHSTVEKFCLMVDRATLPPVQSVLSHGLHILVQCIAVN
jgi:hypothetical protein